MSAPADMELSDELVARACAGEEGAQAHIYRAVAPAVFGLIRRLVGARPVAEDLFHDTMITAYERLHTFRGEAPLAAWVRSIAVSKCLMHLRSPWHRARLALSPDAAELPDAVTQALAPESVDLERALAELAPTPRAVVWLFDVEGWSHEEIAAAFGRTTSFSKSQLARAHRRLRVLLTTDERHTCAPT